MFPCTHRPAWSWPGWRAFWSRSRPSLCWAIPDESTPAPPAGPICCSPRAPRWPPRPPWPACSARCSMHHEAGRRRTGRRSARRSPSRWRSARSTLLAGTLALPGAAESPGAALRNLLDGLVIAAALWFVGWVLVSEPTRLLGEHTPYPCLPLLLPSAVAAVAIGLTVVLAMHAHRPRHGTVRVALGVTLVAVAATALVRRHLPALAGGRAGRRGPAAGRAGRGRPRGPDRRPPGAGDRRRHPARQRVRVRAGDRDDRRGRCTTWRPAAASTRPGSPRPASRASSWSPGSTWRWST